MSKLNDISGRIQRMQSDFLNAERVFMPAALIEILELISEITDEMERIEDLNIKTRRALNLLSE